MTDMNEIPVDLSKLQREQRQQIIQRCEDKRCFVTVIGTVGRVFARDGIVAEDIEW